MIHVDDNNYTKLAFTRHTDGRRFVEFWTETNGARTAHGGNAFVAADHPTTIHLRLTNNGGTLTGAYSTNGTDWTNMGGTGPLKASGTIGLLAAGDLDAQNKTAAFDYFRVTPDEAKPKPAANDEFDGTSIDGCRWDKIHGWNSNRVKLVDGKLRINTFDADISGADNGPIENLILQTPPSGDWVAETKMTAPLGDAWQLAGFMLFSDNDHYVKYDVVADNDPGPRRSGASSSAGERRRRHGSGAADIAPPASATDTWWLRLTKKGNTYTGAISADGTTWVQSPGSVTVALTNPAIGLMAIGPAQAAPIDVDFDFFRIGTADTEAPTTTSTLAPAAPNGANGWYTSNPTLTLATEAGATTEYKLGSGAYQPYSGPVALAASTTVTYRSKDAAGNVETEKTVTVKVDKAAPVTTATASAQPGADGWYAAAADDHAARADGEGGSGMAGTQFAIDGGGGRPTRRRSLAPVGEHTIRFRSTDNAGLVEAEKSVAIKVRTNSTEVPVVIGGEVPGVLALDVTTPGSLGSFTPGLAKDYSVETSAKVTSSAGDARLTVARPELHRHGQAGQRPVRAGVGPSDQRLAARRHAEHPEDLDRPDHR